MKTNFYLYFTFLTLCSLFGGEQIILEKYFNSEECLNQWYYMQTPLAKDTRFGQQASLQKEGETSFLHIGKIPLIGAPLPKPLKLDENIEKLEIHVTHRASVGANRLAFSISDEPHYYELDFRGRNSGFKIQGYQHPNEHNYISWILEGAETFCRPNKKPFNFITSQQNHKFVSWKLTLNHAEKQLEFTRDGETEPSLIQRGVDLSGVTLKRFYLKGDGNDYVYVKLVLTTKEK